MPPRPPPRPAPEPARDALSRAAASAAAAAYAPNLFGSESQRMTRAAPRPPPRPAAAAVPTKTATFPRNTAGSRATDVSPQRPANTAGTPEKSAVPAMPFVALGTIGHPLEFRHQRGAGDGEPRRRAVESHGAEWQILKVRSVVTGRFEPKAPKLARDVRGALVVARLADSPAHHRVVGELVQSRAQVVGRDRGYGGPGSPGARTLIRPHRLLSAGRRGKRCGAAGAEE